MTRYEYACERLLAWIRDYGVNSTAVFIEDIQAVLAEVSELEDCKERLRELGKFCGCDHVESKDCREQQARHVEEAFEKLQDDNRRLRSLLEHPMWQVIV